MDRKARRKVADELLSPGPAGFDDELKVIFIRIHSALAETKHSGRSEDLNIAAAALGMLARNALRMQKKLWSQYKIAQHKRMIKDV